jgi:transcriptional regulator with PAS, ATPase and Fis domain
MEKFGSDRVLKPKGSLPVTAWKLDNRKEINENEIRLSINMIHVEWDSFSQICHSCNFEESAIKAKIIYTVERRGKLHNPYTNSGGILTGTVEEIGENERTKGINIGDEVICAASMTAIPIKIEMIDYIDYSLGEVYCKGYAIVFSSTTLINSKRLNDNKYSMLYFDEGAAPVCVNRFAKINQFKNVGIIARDVANAYIYALAVRKNNSYVEKVIALIDDDKKSNVENINTENEIHKVFDGLIDDLIITDFNNPMESYDELVRKRGINYLDYIILSESMDGAEDFSVLLCKEFGGIFFTGVKNNYMSAALTSESMGKSLKTYSFDTFTDGAIDFTVDLIYESSKGMKNIDDYYNKNKVDNRFGYINDYEKVNNATEIDGFIYGSQVTKSLLAEVVNTAKFDCNVVIEGETGTGKEMIVQMLHENSKRKHMPLIKINCATIQENLGESEFFGYEKGAFTGALNEGKEGYFSLANNGILFLDEVSELSLSMQSKLLRVLQTNEFYKVGGTKQISVDVRVICASNINLLELVENGRFREDLYYRLNIASISVPPLRERTDDIAALTDYFLIKYGKRYGITRIISESGMNVIKNSKWPGNVRELENTVHRLIISSKGEEIGLDDVNKVLNRSQFERIRDHFRTIENENELDYKYFMDTQEKWLIEYALNMGKTTRKAAEILNMSQTTFNRKKIKYKL